MNSYGATVVRVNVASQQHGWVGEIALMECQGSLSKER